MSDMKLFCLSADGVQERLATPLARHNLKKLMEKQLAAGLGLHFLASNHDIGSREYIDALALDRDGRPVIISCQQRPENLTESILHRLDWLQQHPADFQLLVQKKLGEAQAEAINWSEIRLLALVALSEKFSEQSLGALRAMTPQPELIRYQAFAPDLLLLELINGQKIQKLAMAAATVPPPARKEKSSDQNDSARNTLKKADQRIKSLYAQLRSWVLTLGEGVEVKEYKTFFAFHRAGNFVGVLPRQKCLKVYLNLGPATVNLEAGFSCDASNKGHNAQIGKGDVEFTLKNPADLEKLKPYLERAYREHLANSGQLWAQN